MFISTSHIHKRITILYYGPHGVVILIYGITVLNKNYAVHCVTDSRKEHNNNNNRLILIAITSRLPLFYLSL